VSAVRRRLCGFLLFLVGLALVALQFAWTTRDATRPLPLPPLALNAAVYLLGLSGLLMIYFGFGMMVRK
jgi:hypothetical protein